MSTSNQTSKAAPAAHQHITNIDFNAMMKPAVAWRPLFEYAEHRDLGQQVRLTIENGASGPASTVPLTLTNGAKLTYGEICAFAGDFYGTYDPISDGTSPADLADRFMRAFNTLDQNAEYTPDELTALKTLLEAEVVAYDQAVKEHKDPSIWYSTYDINSKLQDATSGRPWSQPGYYLLARVNWDHFGADAHTVYRVGHTLALREASKPGGDLRMAYKLNAFADHFLQDSFSAGHVRTPRREMHESWNPFSDMCAKLMHDEDSAIGLDVVNKGNKAWHMLGDKRLSDTEDDENAKLCREAVQASVDEVYHAWRNHTMLDDDKFTVWQLVPDLEAVQHGQKLSPLFKYDQSSKTVLRRDDITNRHETEYIPDYTYGGTYAEAGLTGLWKDPIKMT